MTEVQQPRIPSLSAPIDELRAWQWWRELEAQERSQSWLARRTGVSAGAVSRFKLGSLEPSEDWLRQVVAVLGPVAA